MNNTIEFKSIGTQWFINIYDNISDKQKEIITKNILELTNEFENLYSRFKSDSLISKINRGETLAEIPEDLSNMLNIAENVRVITDNHFNIEIGQVLNNIGYNPDYTFAENNISLPSIDLGGIGKGYLIDKVRNLISESEIKYFFINAGGDIFATSNYENPIEFSLQDPFDKTQFIGTIKIKNQSIAASSPSVRNWIDPNTSKKFHHLVDYKSSQPVTNIAGTFTLADNAINADLASTALFVSPDNLHNKIAENLKCEFLIVFKDSSFKISKNYSALLN